MSVRTRSSQAGFTLVELLIVIAILTLLAGILCVATASLREKTRHTVCVNNLKQIYVALTMYRDDYNGVDLDGRPHTYWELGLPPLFAVTDALTPYLKDKPVWRCYNDTRPSNKYVASYTFHWPPYDTFPDGMRFSKICGERLLLASCSFHGYEQMTDLYFIIPRWEGEVKGQYVRFPLTQCLDGLDG